MQKISFEGIGSVVATFTAGEGVKVGAVVKISGSGAVSACVAGDRFCGAALALRDGCAAVQVGGLATLAASGAVALGWVKLSADGAGGVKPDTGGGEFLVVATDTGAGTAVVRI